MIAASRGRPRRRGGRHRRSWTRRRCEVEFGLGMEFVQASAEDIPLPDASFDLAISEYGASIRCEQRA